MRQFHRSSMLRFAIVPLLLCVWLFAQQAPPSADPVKPQESTPDDITFRGGVEVVSTPALVFDRDGKYANGLQAQDFRLFDNGKQQNIEVDVTYVPISLVICIQANAHVQGLLPQVSKRGNLIKPVMMGDQGEAALIAYDGRVRPLQEFTSDSDKITAAVRSITPGSMSNRLIDSVEMATRMLRSRPPDRRRLIMLIGETRDISSTARARETLINLQLSNIVFYGVDMSRFITTLTAPPPVPRPNNNPPAIRGPLPLGQASTPTSIAQMTGGEGSRAEFVPLMVEVFKDIKAVFKANPVEVFTKGTGGSEFGFHSYRTLEEAIERMGEELHSGYVISYRPDNKEEGGFHAINID